MGKIILILILLSTLSADTLKYDHYFYSYKNGDAFHAKEHYRNPLDSIKSIINGRLTISNFKPGEIGGGGGTPVDLDTITSDTIKVNYGLQATRIKVDYLNSVGSKSIDDTITNLRVLSTAYTQTINNTNTITTDSIYTRAIGGISLGGGSIPDTVITKRLKIINNGNQYKSLAVFDYNNTNPLGGRIEINTINGISKLLFNCYPDTTTGDLKTTYNGRTCQVSHNVSTGVFVIRPYGSSNANASVSSSSYPFSFDFTGVFSSEINELANSIIFNDDSYNKNQILFQSYDWDIYEDVIKNTITHYDKNAVNGHQKNCLVLHSYFGNINLGDSTFTGNVGIGKDTAIYKLDVNGNIRASNIKTTNDTSTTAKTEILTADSGYINKFNFTNISKGGLPFYEEGTFQCTVKTSDLTAQKIGTASYVRLGKLVTAVLPALNGTSNSTSFRIYGFPEALKPTNDVRISLPTFCFQNSTAYIYPQLWFVSGLCHINRTSTTNLTSSGTKGLLAPATINYRLP